MNQILFLTPIFKQMVWGGNRLATEFGYPIPGDDTGECWGICAHPSGDAKVRAEGIEGKTLSQLWKERPELFGRMKGDRFPLLIKIIDARADLSIQVHPDDAYAAAHENGSLGKMECWYVIDCPKDARLVLGHNAESPARVRELIEGEQWEEFLRYVPVKKGDFIQIDPGTVHAITTGCLLLETQQNSDITYRVYDYGRLSNGKPRELHVQKSIDVIAAPAAPAENMVTHAKNLSQNVWNQLISCQYYTVWKLDLEGEMSFEQKYPFLNVSVIEGEAQLNGTNIKKGDHFILPAEYGMAKLRGKAELIASAAK
ncbi:MAG: class I mannose-6-phosphate isomerase [Lachnospiraceae bacterium]|nr:class I mannose-6-phosphate isomerase [Lachnospiraceae bacterium]MCM1257630.1 class I mannose-6-phosphate isomerase [Roseburia sp.]